MPSNFPPIPVYPKGYDDDSTLFLVYNTSETITVAANAPWSEEILIKPIAASKPELWADNGFANIEGELFYYDSVEKNSDDRIYKLKRCARNLGGTQTKHNPAGSEVRGYVLADHHNQLVDSILKVEEFIGENFSEDCGTLDWRIRNLQGLDPIFDDFSCPDVSLTFNVISSNPASGVLTEYSIVISGSYNSFRLDFGDGSFTTSTTSGQHRYAQNANIDPIVTVSNTNCSMAQSPVERTATKDPSTTAPSDVFEISIPTIPDFPNIVFPDIELPSNTFNIPPIVFPCLDIGAISIPSVIVLDTPIVIPSSIDIIGVSIPSLIVFSDPNIPSVITFANLPSIITVESDVSLPSIITVTGITLPSEITLIGCSVPSIITVSSSIPSIIILSGADGIPSIIGFDTPPELIVTWEAPPSLICTVQVECPSGGSPMMRTTPADFQDGFAPLEASIDTSDLGIPTEIKLIVPEIPDVRLVHDLPAVIRVIAPDMPTEIKMTGVDLIPREIKISAVDVPTSIILDATMVPSVITLQGVDIPTIIKVVVDEKFPSSILLDASQIPDKIQVVGIPPSIELIGNIPTQIQLVMPENPEIPLVYKGAPIEMKITLDTAKLTGEKDMSQCFSLVPCVGN